MTDGTVNDERIRLYRWGCSRFSVSWDPALRSNSRAHGQLISTWIQEHAADYRYRRTNSYSTHTTIRVLGNDCYS